MRLKDLVDDILQNAADGNDPKAYRDIYFIKVINPGDRKGLFVSFRYNSSKKETFICTVEINLELTDKNVFTRISFLAPWASNNPWGKGMRESTTFFKKSEFVPFKNIQEILKQKVTPLLTEKLQKVEDMYVSN